MEDNRIEIDMQSHFEGDDYEWALCCLGFLYVGELGCSISRVRQALSALWVVADTPLDMSLAAFDDVTLAVHFSGSATRKAGQILAMSVDFLKGKRRMDLPDFTQEMNDILRVFVDLESFRPIRRDLRIYLIREGRLSPNSL